jgi:hypothetical protein
VLQQPSSLALLLGLLLTPLLPSLLPLELLPSLLLLLPSLLLLGPPLLLPPLPPLELLPLLLLPSLLALELLLQCCCHPQNCPTQAAGCAGGGSSKFLQYGLLGGDVRVTCPSLGIHLSPVTAPAGSATFRC